MLQIIDPHDTYTFMFYLHSNLKYNVAEHTFHFIKTLILFGFYYYSFYCYTTILPPGVAVIPWYGCWACIVWWPKWNILVGVLFYLGPIVLGGLVGEAQN